MSKMKSLVSVLTVAQRALEVVEAASAHNIGISSTQAPQVRIIQEALDQAIRLGGSIETVHEAPSSVKKQQKKLPKMSSSSKKKNP